MTINCPGCSASLKFDADRLAGRRRAKCPRCQSSIELPAQAAPGAASSMLSVTCGGCGARLKAPAQQAGGRSKCPRCGEPVTIAPAEGSASAPTLPPAARPAAPGDAEESSGAATRRIDSRTLGMELAGMRGSAPPPGGVDLDEFIRTPPSSEGQSTGGGAAGRPPAVSLLRPPVAAMAQAAEGIREAARGMDPRPGVAEPSREAVAPRAAATPRRETERHHERPGRQEPPRFEPYPVTRGLAAGALAGGVVGGLAAAAADLLVSPGWGWLLSPLLLPSGFLGAPDAAIRMILLAVSGGLAGLIAAGAGSPARDSRPLSARRCLGFAALPGVALGLVSLLTPAAGEIGLTLWPAVNWMRDLLLVGLLTPALNKVLPGRA
ncbi:MAG TPA: hypothetical protein VJV23_00975 [Candidatus Polarisedimenticolia bacterium]|nr:hypothetical protein [Candidatus Polarisedimenticolia bacterium]